MKMSPRHNFRLTDRQVMKIAFATILLSIFTLTTLVILLTAGVIVP